MYLLTAVADLAVLDPKTFGPSYVPALKRLWDNMVNKRMYLTGGIGAISKWEGFGIDYFLPQSTDEGGCYAETCAAIGVMMLAERMLQVKLRGPSCRDPTRWDFLSLFFPFFFVPPPPQRFLGHSTDIIQIELDGRYTDVLERVLYNAMLTGMSVDGKAFTYVNQIATSEEDASNKREEWFECACCPPNVARVLGHIGGYLWTAKTNSETAATINVHLYASALLDYTLEGTKKRVKLCQTTNYPWEGSIDLKLENNDGVEVDVNIRIPAWAGDSWEVTTYLPAHVPGA
jgi:uncharacterized protein